jgi:hypothetical protein
VGSKGEAFGRFGRSPRRTTSCDRPDGGGDAAGVLAQHAVGYPQSMTRDFEHSMLNDAPDVENSVHCMPLALRVVSIAILLVSCARGEPTPDLVDEGVCQGDPQEVLECEHELYAAAAARRYRARMEPLGLAGSEVDAALARMSARMMATVNAVPTELATEFAIHLRCRRENHDSIAACYDRAEDIQGLSLCESADREVAQVCHRNPVVRNFVLERMGPGGPGHQQVQEP